MSAALADQWLDEHVDDPAAWPMTTTPTVARRIERWRPVPGWEGLYRVSDEGGVWSEREGRLVALALSRHGWVRLYRDGVREHARVADLVEAAFGPNNERRKSCCK